MMVFAVQALKHLEKNLWFELLACKSNWFDFKIQNRLFDAGEFKMTQTLPILAGPESSVYSLEVKDQALSGIKNQSAGIFTKVSAHGTLA